jgi:hypothetical protein
MFWRRVLHSHLIINVNYVIRIWPWDIPA